MQEHGEIVSKHAKSFFFEGGPKGVLLLHGFSASCAQVRPLGEFLRGQGFTVSAPLLPGHGTRLSDFGKSGWRQWLDAAAAALLDISERCESVAVAGLSMGGILALLLAQRTHIPAACVCMSVPISFQNRLTNFAPLIAPFYPYHPWGEGKPCEDMLLEYHIGYPGVPMARMADLLKLIRMARRDLCLITCPVLVVQSLLDETVHPRSAGIILSQVSSAEKEVLTLSRSPHVVTLGPEREALFQRISSFLQGLPPKMAEKVK